MRDWKLTLLVIGIYQLVYGRDTKDMDIDLFVLCPSLMSGIQECADKYMPGKQTPIMAMFDPKAIGKIDLNLGSYKQMCSTMIDQMESHFNCINTVLNTTSCPALKLELADLLNPNMLQGMKRSWKYTCQHTEILASEAAQTCLIQANKQMLRCITKKSREKKLKDAIEDVRKKNQDHQEDVVKINNCILYSLSSACFKEALGVSGCPQNISDISWQSVKLVIPRACTTGPYAVYSDLYGTNENSSGIQATGVFSIMLMTFSITNSLIHWT